jgi:hypothetical protein
MVTITKTKLIIEIEHTCPADLLEILKDSLIFNLQQVEYSDNVSVVELKESNYFLLLLLKEMLRDGK